MKITQFRVLYRLLMAVCAALALSAPTLAQSGATQSNSSSQPKNAAPSAAGAVSTLDQILDRYVEASGGRDALKKLTTRDSKGTIDIPAMNMSGTVEIRDKAPNKTLATVTIGGNSFLQGYDGKVAWSSDPQNGLRELTDGELEETQRDADFYRPLDLKTLYKKITVVGAEKIGDRDTYLVEGTIEGSSDPEKMYFDAQTGLLIRIVGPRHTPDGISQVQIDLSDYRDVDGAKVPFSIQQSIGEMSYTISFTEIHHNAEMDDAQFAKPAEK